MVESRVLKIKNGTIYIGEDGHIMIDEVRKENVITTDFTLSASAKVTVSVV